MKYKFFRISLQKINIEVTQQGLIASQIMKFVSIVKTKTIVMKRLNVRLDPRQYLPNFLDIGKFKIITNVRLFPLCLSIQGQ